jgi:hypothetical protein
MLRSNIHCAPTLYRNRYTPLPACCANTRQRIAITWANPVQKFPINSERGIPFHFAVCSYSDFVTFYGVSLTQAHNNTVYIHNIFSSFSVWQPLFWGWRESYCEVCWMLLKSGSANLVKIMLRLSINFYTTLIKLLTMFSEYMAEWTLGNIPKSTVSVKLTAVSSKRVVHADVVAFKSFSECEEWRGGWSGGWAGCVVVMGWVKRKQTNHHVSQTLIVLPPREVVAVLLQLLTE